MNDFPTSSASDAGIERLLTSLAGIVSARVISGSDGELEEVHILASDALHPKQVVRNVESALSAGLGIEVDRRIISVAQIRPGAVVAAADVLPPSGAAPDITGTGDPARIPNADPTETDPTETDPTGTAPNATAPSATAGAVPPATPDADARRAILVGFDSRVDSLRQSTCRVQVRWGPDEFTGQGQGPDTVQGRAEAAARAVFAAFAACRGTDRLALEGVAVVEAHGTAFILVAARTLRGRRSVPLTGAARLEHAPEEAAILATLQATNHWRASP